MAYRQFRNEDYYKAPQIDYLPRTLQVLDTAMKYKKAEQARQQNLLDDWKSVVSDTTIPSDNRKLNQLGAQVTQMAMKDIQTTGQLTPQTRMFKDEVVRKNAESKSQAAKLKAIDEAIRQRRIDDPYYKSEYDEKRGLETIADNDLPYSESINQRNSKLDDLSNSIGSNVRETFDMDKATSDFVKNYATHEGTKDITDPNGVQSKEYFKANFINDKGVPEITEQHVGQLLQKDKRVYDYLYQDSMDDIHREWQSYKNKGKDIPKSLQGLDDDQAAIEIANNPKKYSEISGSKTMGERITEKGKAKLKQFEDIRNDHLIDRKDQNPGARFGITSNKLNAPADGFNNTNYSGPARTLTTKNTSNPYISFNATAKASVDPNDGTVDYNQLGQNSILKNYYWGPYRLDKQGNKIPVQMKASDDQNMVNQINSLPNSKLNPSDENGIAGVAPILNVSSIDKRAVMDLAFNKQNDLESNIASNPNDDKSKADLAALTSIMEKINADQDYNAQYLQKILGVDVLRNRLIVAEPGDQNVQALQSISGMDIYSPKSRNKSMDNLVNTFSQRQAKARSANYQDQEIGIIAPKKEKIKPSKPRIVNSLSEAAKPKETPLKATYKIGDKDYSGEQVKKAADASGMTVDEYLNEINK